MHNLPPRPRVLPGDRWLVSAPDWIHHRVYKRAGLLYRLLRGRRWRCVSGDLWWLEEVDAWRWVESRCVNNLTPNDWHGVGYARWMQNVHYPRTERNRFGGLAWLSSYTTEPPWVYQLYHDGPPRWSEWASEWHTREKRP